MINQVLAVIETRKIDNGCSIKYHNEIYQPYENNKIVPLRNKTEILVIKTFDNQLLLSHNEKVYELVRLESHMKTSMNFDSSEPVEPNTLKERKKYVPKFDHPWRRQDWNSFKNSVNK